jgi:hypothetical protein
VERLRAVGTTGVQRISVGDKDYDVDLDIYKTNRDACEWLKHYIPLAIGFAARRSRLEACLHRVLRRIDFVTRVACRKGWTPDLEREVVKVLAQQDSRVTEAPDSRPPLT